MFNNISKITFLGLSLALVTGCSTIANGSNQAVNFNTGDVVGADCQITGGSNFNVKENFVSPAEVKLPRSKKALDVTCAKEGYQEATKKVYSKIEATTGGNILIGGIIGVGVDAATGALYKYPDTVVIAMEKLGVVAPSN